MTDYCSLWAMPIRQGWATDWWFFQSGRHRRVVLQGTQEPFRYVYRSALSFGSTKIKAVSA